MGAATGAAPPGDETPPIDPAGILAVLRSTAFVPGSNLRGERSGAAWRFLLDSFELGRVLLIGDPGPAALAAIRRSAREVRVVDRGAEAGGALHDVVVVDAAVTQPEIVVEAAAALGRGGRLVIRTTPAALDALLAAAAAAGLSPRLRASAAPAGGEVVIAVPVDDPVMAALVDRLGFRAEPAQASINLPAGIPRRIRPVARRLLRLARRVGTSRSSPTVAADRLVILERPEAGGPGGRDRVPDWVSRAEAAQTASDVPPGTARAGHWAFVGRGDYDSQKPIVLLADETGRLETVVKMTRSPVWTPRLEIERRALQRLAAGSGTWRHLAVPTVRFASIEAGLAILGETALEGASWEEAARTAGTGRPFEAAVEALRELGRSTMRAATGADHAAALAPLVDQFGSIWSLRAAERTGLQRDLETIAALPALPAVMLHGDPGTWNLRVLADGRIGALDWEAAEDAGPPLWDLARLVHAYAVREGRTLRPATTLGRARRHLLEGSSLTPRLAAAIQRSATAFDVPPGAIAPLIRLAWLARGLKEVNRLRPDELDRGHHGRLVRLTLDRPGRGWAQLTGEESPAAR